jgi:hypothetical protein
MGKKIEGIKHVFTKIGDWFREEPDLIGKNAKGFTKRVSYLKLRKVLPTWEREGEVDLVDELKEIIRYIKHNNIEGNPAKGKWLKESLLDLESTVNHKRAHLKRVEERLWYITDVARTIAKRAESYNDIIAAKKDEKEGEYLRGFLAENHYDWEALLNTDIFTRAAYYYKAENRVGITRVVKGKSLEDLVKTPVLLNEEVRLKGHEHQPFKRVIFLAEAHLNYAINWTDNYPTVVDGIDLVCTHADATADVIGFPDHNRCVIRIRDAPGTDVEFHKEKAAADNIQETLLDVRRKIIHLQRKKLGPLESRLHEAQLGEKLNKDELEYMRKDDYYKKRRAQKRKEAYLPEEGEKGKLTADRVIMIVLIILLAITSVLGFMI